MTDLILHHYPNSPFAEKARLMLGAKKLAWMSVLIPPIMPKPDVIALTGGYRRTPFMQIGADIYCDTALIARKLEQIAPTPAFFPSAHAAALHGLAQWADSALFSFAVALVFQPEFFPSLFSSPTEMKALIDDRVAMKRSPSSPRRTAAEAKPAVLVFLRELNAQLADGRSYLSGAAPVIADFSVYHPLWFIARTPLASMLQPYEHVVGWMARIKAIGHGQPTEISSAQAIEIAHANQPQAIKAESDAPGLQPGDAVEIAAADYGIDPVAGTLAVCNLDEMALRRTDPRAGEVVVHFPRLNYEIRRPA